LPNINHSFQCADGLFQKAGIDLEVEYDGYGNGKGTIFDCGLCLNSKKMQMNLSNRKDGLTDWAQIPSRVDGLNNFKW
jgi:hypothetical protein